MPLMPFRVLLDYAREKKFGIAAFNVNNMEQIQAMLEAAQEILAPVIVQASKGARKYTNDVFLRHLMLAAAELYPDIPMVLHQDHGSSAEVCLSAIRSGFTSVMMDGSLEEEENAFFLRIQCCCHALCCRCATSWAFLLRADLGRLVLSKKWQPASKKTRTGRLENSQLSNYSLTQTKLLTLYEGTGVEALAVAIGTSHGAYKFSKQPTSDVLVIDRILEIHKRIPECHLVMHGSSSVPQDLLMTINRHGGALRQAWGVPVAEIQRAIKAGSVKSTLIQTLVLQ